MKKYVLGLISVILALGFSAFTKPDQKNTTLYYFPFNGTSYSSLVYNTNTQTPPTSPACTNTHSDQCDGGVLTSDATQTMTAPGQYTWTINSGATIQVKDFRN